ncbi:MAG: hypothetical protein IIZ83_09705 [Oscillospiraceae bacterium]|nr:hypothetical protein [Oscillospiraceae bacterium]
MSEETVVQFGAPTLAGIKTGSLFSLFGPLFFDSSPAVQRRFSPVFLRRGALFTPRLQPLSQQAFRSLEILPTLRYNSFIKKEAVV